jgi:hypothetical protein
MRASSRVLKVAAAFAVAGLVLALMPSEASAGWRRRAVVVATPAAYPAYVAPVTTVYAAPVTTVFTPTVSTVVSAPVQEVVTTSGVVANPVVQTTYVAPAVVQPVVRARLVHPRRVYYLP